LAATARLARARAFRRRDAVLRQVHHNREAWDADVAEPISDFIHATDHVAVRFVWRGRGHGPESNMEVTCVYTVRKGKIIAFEFFWDHAEALEAVGLSEDAGTSS
jgi:ketosteroid isomerase-like protein